LRNELHKTISLVESLNRLRQKVINKFSGRRAMGKDRVCDLIKAVRYSIATPCCAMVKRERIANFTRRLMMINFIAN
jgi:hypothetical protein